MAMKRFGKRGLKISFNRGACMEKILNLISHSQKIILGMSFLGMRSIQQRALNYLKNSFIPVKL